jgi:hypothetical protein
MAINGNHPDPTQHLDPRQRVTPVGRAAPAPDPATVADDVTNQIAETARMIRDIGRYAKEHGDYLQQLSLTFADRLQEQARDFAAGLLASERRKIAELEKILGRQARGGEDGRGT